MHQTRTLLVATAVAASLAVAGAAVASVSCFGVKRTAALTGAAEAPQPGDPDGAGRATIGLNVAEGLVCWSMVTKGIATPVAAHIHKGAPGAAGPVSVTIGTPTTGATKGCVAAGRALIRDIQRNPGAYYVNVHNKDYPGGALRGQLR